MDEGSSWRLKGATIIKRLKAANPSCCEKAEGCLLFG